MTKDLEETLVSLGPGYRAVVDRLLAAPSAPCGERRAWKPMRRRIRPILAAAAVAIVALPAAWFALDCCTARRSGGREYMLAEIGDAEAIREIIATQGADGGWGSDFLTRRNALALRGLGTSEAMVAYKKAMRNLRVRNAM